MNSKLELIEHGMGFYNRFIVDHNNQLWYAGFKEDPEKVNIQFLLEVCISSDYKNRILECLNLDSSKEYWMLIAEDNGWSPPKK